MSKTVEVLEKLLELGELDSYEPKVRGIAQLAIDNGFETLSTAQQRVLAPYLSRICQGVTDPGGHHNDCSILLEDDQLVTALESQVYYGSLLCENCTNENEQYQQERDRIERE